MSIQTVSIVRWRDNNASEQSDRLVVEAPLQVIARGTSVATVMRTPGHDEELVRGLLHAEAIVGADQAALRCTVDNAGDGRAMVDLDPTLFAARGTISTAACGVCGRAGLEDFERNAVKVSCRTTITSAVVSQLPDLLRAEQRVFDATGGLHAAALFDVDGTMLALREDVGRHNAVDKIVGWARNNSVDASRCIIFVSGRLGYELVQKTVRLGAPLLASVSAPSSLAIEVAQRFGVAAIGFVRGAGFNVYANPWRVQA
jgi:FdhD protein